MFFAAMAWYCGQHPDRAEALLSPGPASPEGKGPTFNPLEQVR